MPRTGGGVQSVPQLNFLILPENNNLQFFLKTGFGFHSNDAR
jgi:hypothetical protein